MNTSTRTSVKNSGRGSSVAVLAARNQAEADLFAREMRPVIFELMTSNDLKRMFITRRLAKELNARGIPSFRGGKWYQSTVRRLIQRLGPEFLAQVRETNRSACSEMNFAMSGGRAPSGVKRSSGAEK